MFAFQRTAANAVNPSIFSTRRGQGAALGIAIFGSAATWVAKHPQGSNHPNIDVMSETTILISLIPLTLLAVFLGLKLISSCVFSEKNNKASVTTPPQLALDVQS